MRPAKRALDLVGAGVGVVLLAPLFALVAVAIKAGDGGPVFYRQRRVGRNGREFRIWKFRTMVVDAERAGPPLTAGEDPRVTRVGAVLRRFKVDELPQLLNVLVGEMSLVGPRPEVARYIAYYTPNERLILRHVPGITDPASLAYADEAALLAGAGDPERVYLRQIMPEKIRLSMRYARSATVLSDMMVILQTLHLLPRTEPSPRLRAGTE